MTCGGPTVFGHRLYKPAQEDIDIGGFHLDMEEFIKRTSLGLPNLVIRVVQGENRAEAELFPRPNILCIGHEAGDDFICDS